ncbi:MAG: hypothetical protein CMO26_15705 [Thiotrichales bacterium]|nr:hypothetical protein [Thiotrichales bacterium]|tara:strand:+ start:260 stop:673 length:414 start_codon:yes stop_codon:yes gene_type:complete
MAVHSPTIEPRSVDVFAKESRRVTRERIGLAFVCGGYLRISILRLYVPPDNDFESSIKSVLQLHVDDVLRMDLGRDVLRLDLTAPKLFQDFLVVTLDIDFHLVRLTSTPNQTLYVDGPQMDLPVLVESLFGWLKELT